MAGILADIGRSNVGQVGQSIFGDLMKYKQMERQDTQDAMTMANQARQADLQERGFAIQQAKETRDKAEFDAKEKERSRRLPLTLRWGPMETWSGSKKAIVDEGRKMGLVEDVGGVPTASAKDYEVFIKTIDPAKAEEMSAMTLAEYATDMGEIQRKLAAKPGDEKLVAERDRIVGLYTKQKESHDTLVNALAAKKKAEGEGKDAIAERRLDETTRANQAREDAMNRRLDIMEKTAAETARIAARKAAAGGDLTFAEKEAIRAMGKQLPKTQALARTAEKNIQKIDRMEKLVESGAGGVRGDLLAKIIKVADVFSVTSPEDAKYNVLQAEMLGLAGSLRLQLGLIGQTSDRDFKAMQSAAGMRTPAESQKALLEGYKQGFMQDIDNYNSDTDAYYEAPGMKGKPRIFKPITLPTGGGSNKPTVVETRKTKDGRTLEKLSDGTIREAK